MTDLISDNGSSRRRRYRRWLLAVSALSALPGLHALAGFIGVPWLIRHQLPELVRESLGRELALGEVRFNPFTLRPNRTKSVPATASGSVSNWWCRQPSNR